MVHIQTFLWSFGFLSWLSTYVFITNCWLNGYVYKSDKLIHDSQNSCECLTLNEMHIKLASLIICATNDNLTNMSWTLPPEVKIEIVLYIAHIILYTSTETFIYLKFKDKIFDLFSVLNQHNCCVTVLWKFLQVLISFWVNGVFKCIKSNKLTLDMIFVVLQK